MVKSHQGLNFLSPKIYSHQSTASALALFFWTTYLSQLLLTTMATRSVTTRAKNASQHPGHIVEKDKKKCRTKEEVQLERQAKEDAKQEKARLKADGIKRVAAYEQSQADDDAAEAIPRAPPLTRQLRRTRSYALIPQYEDEIPDSDVDMGDVGDTDAYRSADGSVFDVNDGDDDAKTEPVLASPPRKKTRAEKKAAKPKVRAAVEAAQVEAAQVKELEKAKGGRKRLPMVDNDDVVDLDPTPVKRKRIAVPAAESDDDLRDQAMSVGGKDNELNAEVNPRPRKDEGKGKGKLDANTLKADRRDQKVGSNQTVSDAKRVPPESKKSVISHRELYQRCSLLTKLPFIIILLVTLPPTAPARLKNSYLESTVGPHLFLITRSLSAKPSANAAPAKPAPAVAILFFPR